MERHDGSDVGAPHVRPERIGPYVVLRDLASGAGARFVEAEGPDGARVLLQAVRLRAADGEADRSARQRYERSLGARTAALFDEAELEIRAQGGADTADGGRWTFWAVKLSGGPLSPMHVDLAGVARAILERMVLRHARGRVDPLLSEHALWWTADGRVSVAGVPVGVDPSWLAASIEPPRRHDSEAADGDSAGDLWRLGLALEALVRRGAHASPAVLAFIAELLGRNLPNAQAALDRLAQTALDAPTQRLDLDPPPDLRARVQAPIDAAELPTAIDGAPIPEASTDPALGSADAVTHQTRARAVPFAPPVPVLIEKSGEVTAVDPSEVSTSTQAFVQVAPSPTVENVPPMDPAAVAWAPALFPEGASPWSEVIRPRPARPHSFTGFVGELPEVLPEDVIEPSSLVRQSLPPGPLGPPLPTPVATAIAPPGLTPGRRVAIAAAATLLVLGMVALWGRSRPAPIEALDGLVATAANEVLIDASPSGATVVSEADGRVLGVTPLRFLVPPGADAAVLITRAGHDPQRLVLPDRGGLVATLSPLSTPPCTLAIDAPASIEGVGAEIGAGPSHAIPGAAVVRVRGDGLAGARIVRCPEVGPGGPLHLHFGAAPEASTVRITHPAGATASIEGTEVGVVPAARAVRGAFARVHVTEASGAVTERLVPSLGDVEVQMPTSRAEPTALRDAEPEATEIAPTTIETTNVVVGRDRPRGKAAAMSLLREGTELLQAGKAEQAKARLQACLKADPSAAACHRGLGEAFRRQESTREARAHYARYLELQPDAPDASFVKSLLRQL